MSRISATEERRLLQISGFSAIVGSLIFLSVNIWHDSVSHNFAALTEGRAGVREVFVGVPVGSVIFFVFTIVALVGLYAALREDSRSYATMALATGTVGVVLAIVTRTTRIASVLALANSYVKAAPGSAERAAAMVGDAMTLNAFNWGISTAEILIAISFILFGISMLSSATFGRKLGLGGIVVGLLILPIRPLPFAFGVPRAPASFTLMSILILLWFVPWAASLLKAARRFRSGAPG